MSRHSAHADIFQAIADPTRRQILDVLRQESLPVSELAKRFDVTLSAVSQHIRVLREVGLVTARHEGRERYYEIDAEPLATVADWVAPYETFWNERLAALANHLEETRCDEE